MRRLTNTIIFTAVFMLIAGMAAVCVQEPAYAAAKPAKVTLTSVQSADHNAIKLTWKKANNAKKYQVYRSASKNGKYKLIYTTKSTTFTNKKLTTGKKYFYKVRGVNGLTKGAFSAVKSAVPKLKKNKITGSTRGKTWVKINFSKTKGADGYQVFESRFKNKGYSSIGRTTKLSIKSNGLMAGEVYYFKVRSYKIVDGKYKYSAFSPVQKVATKVGLTSFTLPDKGPVTMLEGDWSYLDVAWKPRNLNFDWGLIEWKSSNPSVVSVDSGDLIAKKEGTATITATIDGITAKKKIVVIDKDTTKYNYDIKFLNRPYDITRSVMYVETNAPSSSVFDVEFYDEKGKRIAIYYMVNQEYADLSLGESEDFGYYKVDGGYLQIIELYRSGKIKVRIAETVMVNGEPIWSYKAGDNAKVYKDIGHIDVGNYEAEQKKWMQSVIDKVTDESMTKSEKMRAIESYMYDISLYQKTSTEGGYIFLAAEDGVPYWIDEKYEFDSCTSPDLLAAFGDMLGYPMTSLYSKYDYGTDEWFEWHFCAQSDEDGSLYWFCHSEDNIYDISTIPQLNLSTWDYYECIK